MVGRLSLAEAPSSRLLLFGGLGGKGYAQDFAGGDALGDHVGDAEGNDPCLARAGAGQNEDGAGDGFNGLALLWIEGG